MFPTVPDDNENAPEKGTFTVPDPAPPVKPEEPVKVTPATDETFTHYVHLADGRVLKADLSKITEAIGNRYTENPGTDTETSTLITGVYPR